MCEDKSYGHHGPQHGWHHGHHLHHVGYKSIVKRTENQVVVPEVLLEVAGVDVGDFVEISIRKVKKHGHHHKK